ncbi:MAG: hypothetical protein FWC82_00860 [Firmicutes bacterium]|nr:hypothetical protein [Bacillota bacterium]
MAEKIGFTRTQKQTMAVMFTVTIILTIGIFFLPWVNLPFGWGNTPPYIPTETPPDPPPTPHDQFRGPRPGISPNLLWETNLGGSEDEYIIAAFYIGNSILLFGNSFSSDYDFDGKEPNGFSILLSIHGRPIQYNTLPGFIASVIHSDNGFLVATNTLQESFVFEVNLRGEIIENHIINLRRENAPNEWVIYLYLDFFTMSNLYPFHAVMEILDPITQNRRFRIQKITPDFQKGAYHIFSQTNSMDFVTAFSHPLGFYLFANSLAGNAQNPYSVLVYYNWTMDIPRNFIISPPIPSYTADAVLPANHRGRYAVVVRCADGIAYLVDAQNDFERHSVRELGQNVLETKTLSGGENIFYIFNQKDVREQPSAKLYRVCKNTLDILGEVNAFRNFTNLFTHTVIQCQITREKSTVFAGAREDNLVVLGLSPHGTVIFETEINLTYTTITKIIETPHGLMAIGQNGKVNDNIRGNFGGTDIWIGMVLI